MEAWPGLEEDLELKADILVESQYVAVIYCIPGCEREHAIRPIPTCRYVDMPGSGDTRTVLRARRRPS